MSGTSAKTSTMVEIANITPRRRWSVGEKVRLIEASMAQVNRFLWWHERMALLRICFTAGESR